MVLRGKAKRSAFVVDLNVRFATYRMICGVNFGPRYSGITSWLINCLNAVSESFAPNDFRRMLVEPILRNELIVNAPPHPWSDCSRHA